MEPFQSKRSESIRGFRFASPVGICYTTGVMSSPNELTGAARYNARLGIVLFIFYLLIYAVFVALSAFSPQTMAKPFIGRVNLAVVYGFGLIVLAFVMSIIYMALCRSEKNVDGGQK
jgi:uncharacterized membrane protein (DUF485 family)